MPDLRISEIATATTPLSGTEVVPVVQGGQTRSVPASYFDTKGLTGFCGGKPTGSEVVLAAVAPYNLVISAVNSEVRSSVAATALAVFSIKNSGTEIGTATFAAAGTLATISISAGTISEGDYITIEAPATADSTLADIAFLFKE